MSLQPNTTVGYTIGYSALSSVTTGSYNTALGVIKCRKCQEILTNIMYTTEDDKICPSCVTSEKRNRTIDEILYN